MSDSIKEKITVKEVEYLAKLSRLDLSREEINDLAIDLVEIVIHIDHLKEAQTQGVAPTSHVLSLSNVFREDQVQASLSQEEALANAPVREGPFFKVPRVIDSA